MLFTAPAILMFHWCSLNQCAMIFLLLNARNYISEQNVNHFPENEILTHSSG